ncbi:MAG: class F sortase [Dactylosporangium sp.]|nr:class F sortase [Dactylosporangium sp.]NNJ60569.1 class F sortase [Dactylosporangium sp.]
MTSVLGAASGILLVATPAAAASTISVSPSTVTVGGPVVISGTIPTSGEPSCPQDDVAILTSDPALFPPDGFGPRATRDATGAFQISYTVPVSTPPGTYPIGMRCGGGNVGVHTELEVRAQVQQTPTGAPPAGPEGTSGEGQPWGGLVAGPAPVRVDLPAIGLSAVVVAVGLTPGGSMTVPAPAVAGWYRLGPVPGEVGPAVLVGHVTSRAGPAVFHRLAAVHLGDLVSVWHADGSLTRFSISAVTVSRKSQFPTAAVFGPTRQAALRLVTCADDSGRGGGQYRNSLIVWATAAR